MLFLDFVTWLVAGLKGYKDFSASRSSRGLIFGSRLRFSTFEQVSKTVIAITVSNLI